MIYSINGKSNYTILMIAMNKEYHPYKRFWKGLILGLILSIMFWISIYQVIAQPTISGTCNGANICTITTSNYTAILDGCTIINLTWTGINITNWADGATASTSAIGQIRTSGQVLEPGVTNFNATSTNTSDYVRVNCTSIAADKAQNDWYFFETYINLTSKASYNGWYNGHYFKNVNCTGYNSTSSYTSTSLTGFDSTGGVVGINYPTINNYIIAFAYDERYTNATSWRTINSGPPTLAIGRAAAGNIPANISFNTIIKVLYYNSTGVGNEKFTTILNAFKANPLYGDAVGETMLSPIITTPSENMNLSSWNIISNYSVNLTIYNDMGFRFWMYFNITSVGDRNMTYTVTNPNTGEGNLMNTEPTIKPVYSCNNVDWQYVDGSSYSTETSYQFWLNTSCDNITIATEFPRSYTQNLNYIESKNDSIYGKIIQINTTADGKKIYILRITNSTSTIPDINKKVIGIISEQHGNSEVFGQWEAKGIIDFLTNTTNETARKIRDNYIIDIILMSNPDSQYYGRSLTNKQLYDLNDHWNDTSIQEINAIKTYYTELHNNLTIDYWIDIHGLGGSDIKNQMNTFTSAAVGGGTNYAKSKGLANNITALISHIQVEGSPGNDSSRGNMYNTLGIIGVTIETSPINQTWTISRLEEIGKNISIAIYNTLGEVNTSESPAIPSNITGLNVNSTSNSSIYLTWTVGANTTSVRMFRNGVNVANLSNTTISSNTSSLINNTCYTFMLIPYNNVTAGNNATVIGCTQNNSVPVPPSGNCTYLVTNTTLAYNVTNPSCFINNYTANVNVTLVNYNLGYPYNDVKNTSTGTILSSNVDNYSITLSPNQQIEVGFFPIQVINVSPSYSGAILEKQPLLTSAEVSSNKNFTNFSISLVDLTSSSTSTYTNTSTINVSSISRTFNLTPDHYYILYSFIVNPDGSRTVSNNSTFRYSARSCASEPEWGLMLAMKVILVLIGLIILVGGVYLFKQGTIDGRILAGLIVGVIVFYALLPMAMSFINAYRC